MARQQGCPARRVGVGTMKRGASWAAIVAATTVMATAPAADASAGQLCGELVGTWDGTNCTTVVMSQHNAEMLITLGLPVAMLDNPTAGPALSDYFRRLMAGWRKAGSETLRDSRAFTSYQTFSGPGAIQSVVVHETFEPFGVQANNAYRSFVFDMAQERRLTLADLFKPGVDPKAAIPPAAAPFLPAVLDAAAPPHVPGSYPFTVEAFQPNAEGPGYTGDYRAFALTADHLILYMPDAPMLRENSTPGSRFVWSMDGGTVQVHVPLSALAPLLAV